MTLDNREQTKSGYVAIVGKPNAGKSTLLNSILSHKLSIVTDKPQTTRRRVLGIHTDDNHQIVFIDTPGLIKPRYLLQQNMMDYVRESLNSCDVLIYIADVKDFEEDTDLFISNEIVDIDLPKILVINKVDTIADKKLLLPIIQENSSREIFEDIIPISALHSQNTDTLLEIIKKHLPVGEFYYDGEILSTMPQRFFTAEFIRETVFELLEQEIPYSTEVQVIEFRERSTGKWYVSAEIIVERQSQKIIIVGKSGSKIKEIGEKSRHKIEEMLEMEIYLELFVKVRPKWRDNKNLLKSYGY